MNGQICQTSELNHEINLWNTIEGCVSERKKMRGQQYNKNIGNVKYMKIYLH